MSKKKEGEAIMRIRMKKLREEANRKLNDHYRSEMNRLRSSFFMVANHWRPDSFFPFFPNFLLFYTSWVALSKDVEMVCLYSSITIL